MHRLRRNRWVQCIASSRSSQHIAVGGVSSEISILEKSLGWDTVINVELKGLVPLSASWHPKVSCDLEHICHSLAFVDIYLPDDLLHSHITTPHHAAIS